MVKSTVEISQNFVAFSENMNVNEYNGIIIPNNESYFSPIFSSNSSQFDQLNKKTDFLIGPKQFIFLSLLVKKEILINIR